VCTLGDKFVAAIEYLGALKMLRFKPSFVVNGVDCIPKDKQAIEKAPGLFEYNMRDLGHTVDICGAPHYCRIP
jgi:hypothetical protein